LRKLCPQFREMEPHGVDNYCCGGGSGFAVYPEWLPSRTRTTKPTPDIKSANLVKLVPLNFLVETGEGRTTFTPKIKTLAERHAFVVLS